MSAAGTVCGNVGTKVEYRELGKTGLCVWPLSFGAPSLGSEVRQIDESEGIGTVLGKALQGVPRDRYYLATKVGRYDQDAFDSTEERVTASVDESLARLGVEYVDAI